ncbi:MAG: Na+/H+ antiporter NhaC family protein [Chitinophagales bacterium]
MPDFVSVIPPLMTIILAVWTKRVVPSLAAGLLTAGWLLKPSPLLGAVTALRYLADTLSDRGNVQVILFLFIFGALTETIRMSGGIKALANRIAKYVKGERGVLYAVWLTTPLTFIDCCFHGIATSAITKPLTEKVKTDKTRLGFVVNATSSLLITLIPFGTTYFGYMVGLISSGIRRTGISASAYDVYLRSVPLNFFAVVMVLITVYVTFSKRPLWHLSRKLKDDGEGEHHAHEAHEEGSFDEYPPRLTNLVVPLGALILLAGFMLWWTGHQPGRGFFNSIRYAKADEAIFLASALALFVSWVLYLVQKIPAYELEIHLLEGGREMLPPIVVLILSWSLTAAAGDLGFAHFVTSTLGRTVPAWLLPVALYLGATLIGYAMGTAWGTWALVVPIAFTLAHATGAYLPLVVGAVFAGGIIGDNASPLGETAILTATLMGIPLMEHVNVQLPYALVGVGVSAVAYLAVGFLIR